MAALGADKAGGTKYDEVDDEESSAPPPIRPAAAAAAAAAAALQRPRPRSPALVTEVSISRILLRPSSTPKQQLSSQLKQYFQGCGRAVVRHQFAPLLVLELGRLRMVPWGQRDRFCARGVVLAHKTIMLNRVVNVHKAPCLPLVFEQTADVFGAQCSRIVSVTSRDRGACIPPSSEVVDAPTWPTKAVAAVGASMDGATAVARAGAAATAAAGRGRGRGRGGSGGGGGLRDTGAKMELVLEDGLLVEAASGLPCAGDEGITLSPRSTA